MMKQKIPMCFSEINLSGHKTRLYNTIILQIIKINLKTHHSTGYSLLVPLTLLLKNNFIEYRFFFIKYRLLVTYSSQFLPTSPPIWIHTLQSLLREKTQVSKEK